MGVMVEISRNAFPFLSRCFLTCFKNLIEISSPRFPPVVAT